MIRWCEYGHAPVRLRSGQRCHACATKREARRATPAQRGYGTAHRNARAMLAASLPDACGYCHAMVYPGTRWTAAHVVDGDPSAGWMVSHPACNERAKVRGASESGERGSAIPAPSRLAFRTGLDLRGRVRGDAG